MPFPLVVVTGAGPDFGGATGEVGTRAVIAGPAGVTGAEAGARSVRGRAPGHGELLGVSAAGSGGGATSIMWIGRPPQVDNQSVPPRAR